MTNLRVNDDTNYCMLTLLSAGNRITGRVFLEMTENDIDNLEMVFGPRKALKMELKRVINVTSIKLPHSGA